MKKIGEVDAHIYDVNCPICGAQWHVEVIVSRLPLMEEKELKRRMNAVRP